MEITAVYFIILAVEIGLSLLLPSPVMRIKHKKDICSKKTRTVSSVVATSALFGTGAFLAAHETNLFNFCILSLFMMLSAAIVQIDARCRIIPNLCLLPMLILAGLYIGFNYNKPWVDIPASIITMLIICMALMALSNTAFHGYFGAGDIKYLAVCGLLFGTSAGMIGTLIGMIVTLLIYLIPMLTMKKLTMKSMIAFGPFIGLGSMIGICCLYLPYGITAIP